MKLLNLTEIKAKINMNLQDSELEEVGHQVELIFGHDTLRRMPLDRLEKTFTTYLYNYSHSRVRHVETIYSD